jgi:hypothetical protein
VKNGIARDESGREDIMDGHDSQRSTSRASAGPLQPNTPLRITLGLAVGGPARNPRAASIVKPMLRPPSMVPEADPDDLVVQGDLPSSRAANAVYAHRPDKGDRVLLGTEPFRHSRDGLVPQPIHRLLACLRLLLRLVHEALHRPSRAVGDLRRREGERGRCPGPPASAQEVGAGDARQRH